MPLSTYTLPAQITLQCDSDSEVHNMCLCTRVDVSIHKSDVISGKNNSLHWFDKQFDLPAVSTKPK